uniref:DUF6738 domain-containing protein n=1 Tax=Cajanus cajan TaxID=3821 RepID=A0A151RAX7_CAJCA|nr:hypothetical protein KK1_038967 [Cajanus cajan]
MTRNNPSILHPIDPKTDRTFLRLVREHIISPSEIDTHSVSVASEVDSTENMGDQPAPRERTLREMAAPDFTYESRCIRYLEDDVPFVLKTGLIHLLPKFHGRAGEDPHKHLKEFHIVCSTMRPHDDGGPPLELHVGPITRFMARRMVEDEGDTMPRAILIMSLEY